MVSRVIGAPFVSLIIDPGRSRAPSSGHCQIRLVAPVSRLSRSKNGLSPLSLAPSPSSTRIMPVFHCNGPGAIRVAPFLASLRHHLRRLPTALGD